METNSKNKINHNLTGLLLCAGLSGRMGTSKALMIYNGLPFAVQILSKLFPVCKEVIVVVGHESEKVKSEILKYLTPSNTANLKFVFNNNYKAGMFSSLQCGLKSIPKIDWILYHFVDQPSIPEAFYSDFVKQLADDMNWLQPSYLNKPGHPILFDNKVASGISELIESSSLRDLSNDKKIKRRIWECNYSEVLDDVDTIEEFNRLNCDS